ncbi:hypothetical protein [Jiella sp. M17.18]|uniref:hypothetical protein n=1 Tax=Jiella sp. M17.18 TaxID=3234247 RepID=UPI0034DE2716
MDHQPPEDERQREARAILERVRHETDPQIGAHAAAMFLRTREHFTAGDADPNDRIEVIGTRIGRLAGVAGLVVFLLLLVRQLVAG